MEDSLPNDSLEFNPDEFNQEFEGAGEDHSTTGTIVVGGVTFNIDAEECRPQQRELYHPVRFNEIPMSEAGGFMVIFGKSGTGKSSILYSLFAACDGSDGMGWSTDFNPETDVFLYFDTEESQNGIEKRMFEAVGEAKPSWLRFWSIVKYSPDERKQWIEGTIQAVRTYQNKRVWLAVNQLQDLSNSGMNAEDESKEVVDWLMRQDYHFGIVVLQENVSEASQGRPSGMLGRTAIQKAEGSLQTYKRENKLFVRTGHKLRYSAGLDSSIEFEGLVAHKVGESLSESQKKLQQKKDVVMLAFNKAHKEAFETQNDLADYIAEITGSGSRNAIETYIKPLLANGFLVKDSEGIKLANE